MAKIKSDDTICAIATPLGSGGLGIVRLSGPEAIAITAKIFHSNPKLDMREGASHTVYYGKILDESGRAVDEVMVTLFRKPRSYTCEDVAEISAHGGLKVLSLMLELLVRQGARMAEPGEFTKRAFLNGRIDLTQAEAVLDLIQAKTEKAHQQAIRQLSGDFSKKVNALREQLIKLCAYAEAYLDFPDEDLGTDPAADFLRNLQLVIEEVAELTRTFSQGALLREGALLVIAGRPNVGKSSLLNLLLARDRAIVSPIPGTTRDALEEELEIGGVLLRVADTAGIRARPGVIEQAGIQKTHEYLERADLVLFVLDAAQEISPEDDIIYQAIRERKCLFVLNKSDLPARIDLSKLQDLDSAVPVLRVSAQEKTGLKELENKIQETVLQGAAAEEGVKVTRLRHQEALFKTLASLRQAEQAYMNKLSLEFVSFDVRQALDALGEMVGEIYTEDILDKIFKEFCIGK